MTNPPYSGLPTGASSSAQNGYGLGATSAPQQPQQYQQYQNYQQQQHPYPRAMPQGLPRASTYRPPPPRAGAFPGMQPSPVSGQMHAAQVNMQPRGVLQWNAGRTETILSTSTVISSPPVRFQLHARGQPAARTAKPLVNPIARGLTAVSASNAPAPPAAGLPGNAAGGSSKWPEALHDYVKRAFARCKVAADQSLTQNALKELITNAITTNTLWTKSWATTPLPTLVGDIPLPPLAPAPAPAPVVRAPPPPPRGPIHMPRPMMPTQPPTLPPQPRPFGQPLRPPPAPSTGGTIGMKVIPGQKPLESFVPLTKAQKKLKRKQQETQSTESNVDLQRKSQRRERFLKEQAAAPPIAPSVDPAKLRVINNEGELDLEAMTIKGTCTHIEKEYLRLTSPPHPSTVRPEPILKQALDMVKRKWQAAECDYLYACSQLKSIRQDCTVQRIKNTFTVLVYETHARVALESGDINEFNQCQTQLQELYDKGISGQSIEFLSYRILYCVYVSLQAKKAGTESNGGQLAMYSVLARVTLDVRNDKGIVHALAVRAAVAMNDYHRFFRLYEKAPNMSGYVMDRMVPTIRLRALRVMCKAYKPNVPTAFVRDELQLKGKEGDNFIARSGTSFVSGSKDMLIDTKSSDIVWVLQDQSSLI